MKQVYHVVGQFAFWFTIIAFIRGYEWGFLAWGCLVNWVYCIYLTIKEG